ncbi:MAG: site-specific integrase, partial [Candidatus Puniceispirillaceae bacterium]
MAHKASIGKTADRHDPLIDGFLQAISAMRAASPNTLAAYRRDLFDCQIGLAKNGQTLGACNADELRAVISWWHQRQLSPRSVARRLSAVRQFMGWAVEDGLRSDNPTRWIDN